ncbi:hypothetical protein LTR37_014310 [Vermiconidia calcicola]|uniref:Uncharacterized protein n=1 Tax=Vermiconidia calcicola TaxID=1690605 RepID=A0ACC3MUC6_9PEZI|nr:hypothetical protein LTR37_014310 [Vermiconidia calcicola]
MKKSQQVNSELPADTTPVTDSYTSPDQKGPDTAYIRDLIDNITSRLIGGRETEFCEQGSRLSDNKRDQQLPLLYELRDPLMEYEKYQKQEARRVAAEEEMQTKPVGKPNANMVQTIKTIVEQRLADKVRDMEIQRGRFEAELKKVQAGNEGQEKKIKNLESRLNKSEDRNKVLESRLNKVDGRNQALESKVETCEDRNDVMGSDLRTATEQVQNLSTKRVTAIEGRLESIKIHVSSICETVDGNAVLSENDSGTVSNLNSTPTFRKQGTPLRSMCGD